MTSVVPIVSEPPLPPLEPPLLPFPPPQAVRASAVIAMPAPAASRRPPFETDLIRYLVFMGAGRGRTKRSYRGRPWLSEMPCLAHDISRASALRRCCYPVVTGADGSPSRSGRPPRGSWHRAGRLSA